MQYGRLRGGAHKDGESDVRMEGTSQRSHAGYTETAHSQANRPGSAISQDSTMATSQESGTSGLTQGMAFFSMYDGPPGLAGAETTNACEEGWAEWAEETIQANFEFIMALRQQDTGPLPSFPGLVRRTGFRLLACLWRHSARYGIRT